MIQFTKMHGLGNDYVYINRFGQRMDGVDVAALARAMSDRHRGIGADGLILICPTTEGADADVRMEMYNADGSRAEMCGNGIRCLAKYVIDHRVIAVGGGGDSRRIRVQTDRGVLTVEALMMQPTGETPVPPRVDLVRVDMGPPVLEPSEIPVALAGQRCVKQPLLVGDERYEMTCVSMGNPHAVVFLASVDAVDLGRLGPLVEHHPLFPGRVNLHLASVQSRGEATMRTWERGSGLTQACGTGACAVLVAGVLEGRLDRSATIHLPGGDLAVEWMATADSVSGSVLMTGPAVEVFAGAWPT